jgi:hypothetical protein
MYSGKIAVPPGGGGIRKIEWNLGKEAKITAGFGILHKQIDGLGYKISHGLCIL